MRGAFGGLLKSFQEDLGSVSRPTGRFLEAFGVNWTSSGALVSDQTAMGVAAVYACVRIIAEDVAKLTFRVWKKQGGARVEATEQPLARILKRPNRWMTPYQLKIALMYGVGLRGNGIGVILRDGRGTPNGLIPFPPSQVSLLEAPDGTIFYSIARRGMLQSAMLQGKPMAIPDYDILHLKGLSTDGIIGLSPLTQLREAIGIAISGEQYSGSLMKNGARPGGVLTHPTKISPEAADRLKATWNSQYTGDGTGKTALLEEGMKWEQLGMTSVDAQFLEQRKFTIEDIARGFRVPPHMLGIMGGATFNNVEQQTRSYYDQVLMPNLRMIEEELAKAFKLPDDHYVEADVRELLRADFAAQQIGLEVQSRSGAISANEWRGEIGRDPYEGGNVFARPLNTAYVDEAGNVVAVTPPGGKPPEPKDTPNGAKA